MRALLLAGAAALACAMVPQAPPEWTVVLGGDTDGMLSPCGCTQPMTGGLRRRAAAIKMLTAGRPSVILENSGLVGGAGRQEELKAQALAETMNLLGADAIHLGADEAVGGKGLVRALETLAPDRLLCSSIAPSPTNTLASTREAGPFLVGGVSMHPEALASALGERPLAADAAVRGVVAAALASDKVPVLLLQGSLDDARAIARRHPELRLIEYRASGSPPPTVERVGETVLATPGEQGKHVVRLVWGEGSFHDYSPLTLGPTFENDPDAARIYARYLQRVDDEKLIERVDRRPSPKFAGNARCGSCHAEAAAKWKKTGHAGALKTLEDDGHGRDPECVGCHVSGLDREGGFRSRLDTPQLADVGCESCHGPGLDHALDPSRSLGKAGPASCAPCHNASHSPNFSFAEFWKRIAH
ncbi:MAG: hypothetical protein M9921_02595 [Fimbriimonadaceae bacterium]|nr:hypothetical protein [Chthonomonadaceae bacterium]MCO5295721.1 hypothetical protein [Fimbriimonadaceae bacterium]